MLVLYRYPYQCINFIEDKMFLDIHYCESNLFYLQLLTYRKNITQLLQTYPLLHEHISLLKFKQAHDGNFNSIMSLMACNALL